METLIPTQNLAIDILALTYNNETGKVYIYVPKRTDSNKRALPGILVQHKETVSHAVNRLIESKLKNSNIKSYVLQEQLAVIDNVSRDKRGHVITIPTILYCPNVELTKDWLVFSPNLELDFDHSKIVSRAFNMLTRTLETNPFAMLMLNEEITLKEIVRMFTFFNNKYNKTTTNFVATTNVEDYLEYTGRFLSTGYQGRKSKIYKINKERLIQCYI